MGETMSKYYIDVSSFISYLKTPQIEYNKEHIMEAIDKLRATLQFLDDKIINMNNHMEKYILEGKKLYKQNNKTGALHQIKLKKMYEKEIMKMESIKFNIETNILHMESVSVIVETVKTIKDTSGHIQLINKNLDISKLETVIEDMCEQRDTSKDIESILSQSSADEYDEDELLKELQDSDNNDTDNSKEIIIPQTPFPEVPTHSLEIISNDNDNSNNGSSTESIINKSKIIVSN